MLLKQRQVLTCASVALLKQQKAFTNVSVSLLKQRKAFTNASVTLLKQHRSTTMSNPTDTSTSPNTLDNVAANEAAYTSLADALSVAAAGSINLLNLKTASNRALSVYQEATKPDATEWLSLVHPKIFNPARIPLLLTCAQAAAHIYAELSNAKSLKKDLHARLPAALVDRATEHRKKMQKVLDYNVSDIPEAAQILADIRSGTGYEDLSNDLYRLGQLYNQYQDTLEIDRVHFDFADARTAYDLDAQISLALDQNRRERIAFWTQENARIITLLRSHYEEVAGTCRWLLRELSPSKLEDRFPSLFSGRGGRPKKATENAETPAATPSPAAP